MGGWRVTLVTESPPFFLISLQRIQIKLFCIQVPYRTSTTSVRLQHPVLLLVFVFRVSVFLWLPWLSLPLTGREKKKTFPWGGVKGWKINVTLDCGVFRGGCENVDVKFIMNRWKLKGVWIYRIFTVRPVCWRMLVYADVCWRMLTYADVQES